MVENGSFILWSAGAAVHPDKWKNLIDKFIYVLKGTIEIDIVNKIGLINQNENIFIPRGVMYDIHSIEETKLMEISFSSLKS